MIKVGGKKSWFEIEFLVIIQPVIAPRLEKDLSSILGQVDFLGGQIIWALRFIIARYMQLVSGELNN